MAVRRKCATGDAQRRISSTADSMSSGCSPRRAYCSGFSIRAHMPQDVELRVVSFPASVSSNMNMSNSTSESESPSICALTKTVTMSSRGSARRWRASSFT